MHETHHNFRISQPEVIEYQEKVHGTKPFKRSCGTPAPEAIGYIDKKKFYDAHKRPPGFIRSRSRLLEIHTNIDGHITKLDKVKKRMSATPHQRPASQCTGSRIKIIHEPKSTQPEVFEEKKSKK